MAGPGSLGAATPAITRQAIASPPHHSANPPAGHPVLLTLVSAGHTSQTTTVNSSAVNAIYHGWGLGGNEIPRDGPNYTGKFQLGLPEQQC